MKSVYANPDLGIRRDAFDRPTGPITIPLDCATYLSESAELREEASEYN
jgi:hypothetical protein